MNNRNALETFAEDLAFSFAQVGVTDAFYVTGGAIAPFTSALAKQGLIRMHAMLNEQSAGIAAEAYGYLDGKPALLIVTSGPGVTNALTAIAAAWTNSSPVIVVSGQARSVDVILGKEVDFRQVGNQHIKTDQIVSSVVKKFLEPLKVTSGFEIANDLLKSTSTGRLGPVWLSLPQDLQRSPKSLELLGIDDASTRSLDYQESLSEALILALSKCERPALLLGAGSRAVTKSILAFAEKYGIPIMTTWPAMDLIPESHPLYCGRPGAIPSTWMPNFINVEADLLIILGARLDLGQTGYNPASFAPRAKVIRVDIDKNEFVRIPPRKNWLNIEGDLRESEIVFTNLTNEIQTMNYGLWWSQIKDWGKQFPKPRELPQEFSDGVSTYELINRVSKSFPNVTIVTGSSGTCIEMLLQSWEIQQGQRVVNSCGIGSMGFALSAGYGVSAKIPDNQVLVIDSDGSIAMNIQDLVTLRSSEKIFKILVLDSNGYKSISLSQHRLGQFSHGSNLSTGLNLPNMTDIAAGIGIPTREITNGSNFEDNLEWFVNSAGSALLNVKVSATEEALPRLVSKPNARGVLETPAMNDLYPIL
jgi:acetolactate synthase-1/2/3 large subunit